MVVVAGEVQVTTWTTGHYRRVHGKYIQDKYSRGQVGPRGRREHIEVDIQVGI